MAILPSERVAITLRMLCDAERDWVQTTIEMTGVNERHQLALIVKHPEPLSELPSQLPRLLLELVEILRAELPDGGFRPPDTQTF